MKSVTYMVQLRDHGHPKYYKENPKHFHIVGHDNEAPKDLDKVLEEWREKLDACHTAFPLLTMYSNNDIYNIYDT